MTTATIGRQPRTAAGALEPVGLDAASEAVYRAMLARPYEPVARLAQRAGLGASEVGDAIRHRAELGLARPSDQGVQVRGRLVEHDHVGCLEQQPGRSPA